MAIYRNSRYVQTTLSSWTHPRKGPQISLDPFQMGTFFDQTVTTYVVKEGDTFESIAFKFYGDSTKWWAIVKANRENEDIFFPLDLAVGTRLFIPPAYVVNRS